MAERERDRGSRVSSVLGELQHGPKENARAPEPAKPEEFEKFMKANRPFMNAEAEQLLRSMNPVDRKRVIVAGTMGGCRDPIAVIRCRVRQAREQELEDHIHDKPLGKQDSVSKLYSPATPEELEEFISWNHRWLAGDAEEVLRSFGPTDQKRVIAAGSMAGICNPIAVLHTRVKKSKDLEQEFDDVVKSGKEETAPVEPVVTFTPLAAMGYMFTEAKVVSASESRFAKPAKPNAILHEDKPAEPLVGKTVGIGGVIEVLAKKYGCSKGDRLRCIGEKPAIFLCEGGKTVPKAHQNSGWRWVVADETEVSFDIPGQDAVGHPQAPDRPELMHS